MILTKMLTFFQILQKNLSKMDAPSSVSSVSCAFKDQPGLVPVVADSEVSVQGASVFAFIFGK